MDDPYLNKWYHDSLNITPKTKNMNLEERLEHEIDLVENDESLTNEQKQREIRELRREFNSISWQEATTGEEPPY